MRRPTYFAATLVALAFEEMISGLALHDNKAEIANELLIRLDEHHPHYAAISTADQLHELGEHIRVSFSGHPDTVTFTNTDADHAGDHEEAPSPFSRAWIDGLSSDSQRGLAESSPRTSRWRVHTNDLSRFFEMCGRFSDGADIIVSRSDALFWHVRFEQPVAS